MANTSILAAFERMWQHVVTLVSNKSDSNHNHNDIYFTEEKLNEKLSSKADTTHNHDNDYDAKGASDTALSSAREYTNTSIANLVNSAPETLDTLGELAEAMKANEDVVDALNSAITNKVNIAQGVENAGKILAVDENGNVTLKDAETGSGSGSCDCDFDILDGDDFLSLALETGLLEVYSLTGEDILIGKDNEILMV